MVSLHTDRQSNVLKTSGTCSGNILSASKPALPLMYATELIMPNNSSNNHNGSQTGLPKLRICLRPSGPYSFNSSEAKSLPLTVDTPSNNEGMSSADSLLPQPLCVNVSTPPATAPLVASSSLPRTNRRRSKMPASHSGVGSKKKRRAKYNSDTEEGEGSDKEWTFNSSKRSSTSSKRIHESHDVSPNPVPLDCGSNSNDLDLTSCNSFLTKVNLKQLINRETFESFPREFQLELCHLLPACDLLVDEEGGPCLHSTALNNDFLSKALREYPIRVEAGEFQTSSSGLPLRNTRSRRRAASSSSQNQGDSASQDNHSSISSQEQPSSPYRHNAIAEDDWKSSSSQDTSHIKLNPSSGFTTDCRVTLTDVVKDPTYLQTQFSSLDVACKVERDVENLTLPDSPCSSVTVALTSSDDVAIIENHRHPLLMSTEDQQIEAELHGGYQKPNRLHRKRNKKRKCVEKKANESYLKELIEANQTDLRKKSKSSNKLKTKAAAGVTTRCGSGSNESVHSRLSRGPVQLPHHFSVTVRQRVSPLSEDEADAVTDPLASTSSSKECFPTTMKLLEEAAAIVNRGVEGKSANLNHSPAEDSLSSTTGGVKSEELSPCGSAASCSSSGITSSSHQVHASSVFLLDTPHVQSTDLYKMHLHSSLLHGKPHYKDSPLEMIHEASSSYSASSPASGSPHSSTDQTHRLSPADHQYLQQLKSTYTMPPPKQTKTLAAMKEKMRVKRLMNQIAKTPLLQQDEPEFVFKPNTTSSTSRLTGREESTSQSSPVSKPTVESPCESQVPVSESCTVDAQKCDEKAILSDNDSSPSHREKNIFSIITHHLTPTKSSDQGTSSQECPNSEKSDSHKSNLFDLLNSETVKPPPADAFNLSGSRQLSGISASGNPPDSRNDIPEALVDCSSVSQPAPLQSSSNY